MVYLFLPSSCGFLSTSSTRFLLWCKILVKSKKITFLCYFLNSTKIIITCYERLLLLGRCFFQSLILKVWALIQTENHSLHLVHWTTHEPFLEVEVSKKGKAMNRKTNT